MEGKTYCIHEWIEQDNKNVCSKCGASNLILKETSQFGIKEGMKSNGRKYTVRDNRKRYFFPFEWISFYESLNDKQKPIFYSLIMTGARIEECLNIKVNHFRWDRNYVTLYVTKVKAKKKETKPEPRDISLSSSYIKFIKKYIKENNLKDNDYLFLDGNKDIDKQINSKSVALRELMKRHLKELKINDYYNFALHNIRKTHGMWLKAVNVKIEEICQRLGHDVATYYKHYGSCDIFKQNDLMQIKNIYGDIYGL
jgi:integrase